jgi:O-antigen/teichoic acid export membrane protein
VHDRGEERLALGHPADENLRAQVIRGSAWVAAWRWSIRLSSLLTIPILTRLLTPRDFGIFTMAFVVAALIEVFSDTDATAALVRLQRPTREHFDTAWTIQAIFGLVLALLIIAIAPQAGRYYGTPEVEDVLYFVSLRCALGGFVNVAVATFRINLQFDKEFRMAVAQRLINIVAALVLAYILRSYWALAIVFVGEKVVAILVTYWMRPYLPRFRLSKFREIWTVSVWMFIAYISDYLGRRLDELIIGGLAPAPTVGQYDLAAECARAPIYEVLDPISRPLFTIYSQFVADTARLKQAYLNVLSVAATISLSAGLGLAVVAPDVVHVAFGSGWEETSTLLAWLSLGAVGLGLSHGMVTLLTASAKAYLCVIVVWLRIAMLVPAIFIGFTVDGVQGIAAGQAIVQLSSTVIWFYAGTWIIPLRLSDILSRIWRPAIASIVMMLIVSVISSAIPGAPVARLCLETVGGAATFSSALALLWWIAGCPDGIEEVAAGAIRRLLKQCCAATGSQHQ